MIQSMPATALPGPSVLGDTVTPVAAQGAQGADFGALLSLEASQMSASGEISLPGEGLVGGATQLAGEPVPATPDDAFLPAGGNILPVDPAIAPRSIATNASPEIPSAQVPFLPEPVPAKAVSKSRHKTPETAAESIADIAETPGLPDALHAHAGRPAVVEEAMAERQAATGVPLAAIPPEPATPSAVDKENLPQGRGLALGIGGGLAPALGHTRAANPHNASEGAATDEALLVPKGGAQAIPPGVAPIPLDPASLVEPPATAPQLHFALPAARVREAELAAVPDAEPSALSAPTPTASGPATQPLPLAAPIPFARPHDFSTLVERLVAAREEHQPSNFALAINHSQFGLVQAHFRHQGEALAVALASSDPDFARAVSVASPPVLPTAASESPGSSSEGRPRADGQAQSQSAGTNANGGFAQPHGGASERREARANHETNPALRRESAPSGRQRGGIYA